MLSRFFNFIEIKTKIASTFPFAFSIAFLVYRKQDINWFLTGIFFVAMFLFDLTTTAINNYIDSKTNHQTLAFQRKTALIIIYCLFTISTILGLYLAYRTDIIILLVGGACFMAGVFYTYGPIPISRMPLGELFSGLFQGFMIPFIVLYINMPQGTFLNYNINFESVSIELKIVPFITLILLSIIPFCTIANIMLANNICDLQNDIAVNRYTLPYYIGKKALYLFAGLYYMTYIVTAVMVIFKILHPICLLSFLTIFIVQKNINRFFAKQEKAVTFIISIKNFVIIMGVNIVLIFVSAIFNH